ncbi:MAG TPA: hypothetical protein VGK84_06895 [Candidatus Tumulicola sp.]
MKRLSALTVSTLAAGAAIVAFATSPARSETIYYQFPALPGPVANCQWFDDNINDRSTDSIVRQTDLIYNRVALIPNSTVAVSGSATTQKGSQVVQFDVAGRLLCADATVIHPEVAEPSPSPPG